MKKLILAIIGLATIISAQRLPEEYELNSSGFKKINDGNPAGNSIEDIVVVGDTIWLATGNGLSRSIDRGATWKNYYDTEPFGTEGISRIAYNNGTIWAATWHLEEREGVVGATGSGIKYSNDNGETWTSIDQPVDKIEDSIVVYGENRIKVITVRTNFKNYVRGFGFTDDAVFIACFGGGVRKSTDFGANWERVVLPPDYLYSVSPEDTLDFIISEAQNLNQLSQSIESASGNVIYIGSSFGLNISTDGGTSWRRITHGSQENSISGDWIVKMNYNANGNAIWAATWRGKSQTEINGASVSYDGGETWSTFLPGIKAQSFGFINRGNIAPSETILTSEEGIFRTNNGGISWIAAPEIFDNVTSVKIASNDFRSVDVGQYEDGIQIYLGSTNDGLARITETGTTMWDGDWKVYLASQSLENKNTTKAFPNPFAPSQEKIKIQYSTNNSNSDVSIRIFDFGMNLVKTLLQNAPRTSAFDEYFEFWDGRNEKGNIVPNGVYFYRIDIGGNEPLFGKIMVLN